MSARPIRYFLICALVMTVPAAFADPVIVNANFGAVPIACGIGDPFFHYAYQGTDGCSNQSQDFNSAPGFGWTFGIGHPQSQGGGLTGPNTNFDPPSFDGLPFTQAAFLQSNDGYTTSLSQDVDGFSAGNYLLQFYLGSRYNYDNGQTVEALIDGQVIGTWVLSRNTPFTFETAWFSVSTGGVHNLEFIGTEDQGDHTAFLSAVDIIPAPEPASLILLTTGVLGGLARMYRR